jgi:hypothetical protein
MIATDNTMNACNQRPNLMEQTSFSMTHTPRVLTKYAKIPINFEHYANPMVHPVTGATIRSYTKLMHNLATAKVWQTAFGRDFGRMAQGDNKTGQKGTNAMFVMTHDEIVLTLAAKKTFHLRKPCCQLQATKRVPSLHPNKSGG